MFEEEPVDAAAVRCGNVIGIDIGGTTIDVALADGAGLILERIRLDTLAGRGPEQALARITDVVGNLSRRSAAINGRQIAAHAAVCAGVLQADRILLAPNLPGWENLALASRLARELRVDRVDVSNDVQAGALAELRFGALRGVDPGVYVSLGTGVAAALVVKGQVVLGSHHAAGEIAYLVPIGGLTGPSPDGAAPFEELVGGKALGERASALLGGAVSARELFARTDPAARRLVQQALEVLSIAVANLAVFVDPERVVIGGGMMASAEVILPVLAERLKQTVPFAPDLVAAHFTEDASLHGAVALALDMAGSIAKIPDTGAPMASGPHSRDGERGTRPRGTPTDIHTAGKENQLCS